MSLIVPNPLPQTPWDAGCDVWWEEAMEGVCDECEPEWLDAEDPLFILYTSGSTGKPKVHAAHCPLQAQRSNSSYLIPVPFLLATTDVATHAHKYTH